MEEKLEDGRWEMGTGDGNGRREMGMGMGMGKSWELDRRWRWIEGEVMEREGDRREK